jgi:hypothetical protein
MGIVAAIVACGPPRATPTEPTPPAPTSDARVVAVADGVPAPVPLDRDLPALAAKLADLYHAAADTVVAAGTDCARATAGLASVRSSFSETRDAIAKVGADKDRMAALEPELSRYGDAIKADIKRMGPTLDACRTDATFNAALEGLAPGG